MGSPLKKMVSIRYVSLVSQHTGRSRYRIWVRLRPRAHQRTSRWQLRRFSCFRVVGLYSRTNDFRKAYQTIIRPRTSRPEVNETNEFSTQNDVPCVEALEFRFEAHLPVHSVGPRGNGTGAPHWPLRKRPRWPAESRARA